MDNSAPTSAASDAPVPVPDTSPASPPAAATVVNGLVTEETLRLREQLTARENEIEELRRQVKAREISISEYEDRLHALETPRPVPVRKRAPESQPFLIGRFRLKPTR